MLPHNLVQQDRRQLAGCAYPGALNLPKFPGPWARTAVCRNATVEILEKILPMAPTLVQ